MGFAKWRDHDSSSTDPEKRIVRAVQSFGAGASLGLFAIMGLYNAAAWINRRERHLAVNAVIYCLGVAWERRLVAHHIDACREVAPVATLTLCTRRNRRAAEIVGSRSNTS